jgi:outer membrane lipoprotein-sorting protein
VNVGRRAFVVAISFAVVARADAPDAGEPRESLDQAKLDALLADVAKARRSIKSLRASLTQERKMTLLATTIKSTGQLAFVAPDRLRWELEPPDDVVYFVGPEGLAYRTKTQTTSVPAQGANVGRALSDLRALVGGDLGSLRDRYVLSATRTASEVEISGAAKDPKTASVRAWVLTLDKTLTLPVRARLVEGKSDTIDVVFSGATLNPEIDPKTMRP